ncbi:MAG: hypothetical protein LBN29_06035 [Mediterranea sp.]|jgi:type I site-specific restriction-modification system R (restriction) subunit|nr:hypothetical protein [Mediterranea sp.]
MAVFGERVSTVFSNSFKYAVFYRKVSVLSLLKKYSEGIEYLKTWRPDDFERSYLKNMYLKSFEIMRRKAEGDSVSSIRLYTEIVGEIQQYIDKSPSEDAVCDLYTIRSQIENRDTLIQEIESLKATGRYDPDFLEALASLVESLTADENAKMEKMIAPSY